MATQPICEPVVFPLDRVALVSRVDIAASASPIPRLLHFHDVVEIILFDDAGGRFLCETETYAITPGCAVFAPSMRYHAFDLEPGAKSWTLIQFEPYLLERLERGGAVAAGLPPFCVQPDPASARHLSALADWLVALAGADAADPLIEHALALILGCLARLPAVACVRDERPRTHLSRFFPAVQRLRAAPGERLTLGEAATLCNVSPAYFSRRFSSVFGCGFADYVASYRLHLAARRIATTDQSVSEVAYALGFASHSHFTASFRERFGIAPRDYRRRMLAGGGWQAA